MLRIMHLLPSLNFLYSRDWIFGAKGWLRSQCFFVYVLTFFRLGSLPVGMTRLGFFSLVRLKSGGGCIVP